LKNRLKKEGSESVTKCNRLKMEAADGKKYLTDVANPESLLRLIQSVPSPKAEPIIKPLGGASTLLTEHKTSAEKRVMSAEWK